MSAPPSTAWEEGHDAFQENPQRKACPYDHREPHLRAAWLEGWKRAELDAKGG